MRQNLAQLMHEIEARKIFQRNRKDVIKNTCSTIIFLWSLRKASQFMSIFWKMSHESVRTYYHRVKDVIKQPEKREAYSYR